MKIYIGSAVPQVEDGEFLYQRDNVKIVEPLLPPEQVELALAWARYEITAAAGARALGCSPMTWYGKAAKALAQAVRTGRLEDKE